MAGASGSWGDGSQEFNAAFDEAVSAMPVPHYPSQRYIDKNLAPENTLTGAHITALASARKQAETNGVLTPELGAHLLPMAMVEGRGDFGGNVNRLSAKPSTLERFQKMGLSITDMTNPAEIAARAPIVDTSSGGIIRTPNPNAPPMGNGVIFDPKRDGNKVLQFGSPEGDPTTSARVMAFMLASKHKAGASAEDTVRAYNGAGPATEKYLAKVQDAKRMLAHPKNRELMDAFNETYLKE